jgi:predicted nucleic acid-binding protein
VTLVIDASATVKWLLNDAVDEQDRDAAISMLPAFDAGRHELLQPEHWLAEVLSVIARRAPDRIDWSLVFLRKLDAQVMGRDEIYRRAAELAHRLNHHLFDTLYHAVALETGGTLITADERYFSVANGEGSIQRLKDFHAA